MEDNFPPSNPIAVYDLCTRIGSCDVAVANTNTIHHLSRFTRYYEWSSSWLILRGQPFLHQDRCHLNDCEEVVAFDTRFFKTNNVEIEWHRARAMGPRRFWARGSQERGGSAAAASHITMFFYLYFYIHGREANEIDSHFLYLNTILNTFIQASIHHPVSQYYTEAHP